MATNPERSAATQSRLIEVARQRFALDGYASTSTDAILEGAGVRRGALYHHFADKAALFEAVCARISEEAFPVVEKAAASAPDPFEALVRGSIAWIAFVTRADTRRILLVDAPTVLGWERWDALDQQLGHAALRQGVVDALAARAIVFRGDPTLLAAMLNGALNALALRIGAPSGTIAASSWKLAVRALFAALAPDKEHRTTERRGSSRRQ